MKEISYWLDTPYAPRALLDQDTRADVVIVGGGITGVASAYFCAKAGLQVVLIEQGAIASGSAGKNGGMVVEGLHIDFDTAVERLGSAITKEAWQKTIDARETVASLIAEHDIACDFSRPGSLYVASTNADTPWLQKELTARHAAGFSGQLIDQFAPHKKALFVAEDCVLHPVQFVRGLTAVAEQLGVRIFEQTPALSFDASSVVTPGGTIHAEHVVLAIESEKADLLAEEVEVKRELVVVTEPIPQLDMTWNQGGMFWNTDQDYIAVRTIGDRLFLNGSIGSDPTREELDAASLDLIKRFMKVVPQAPESAITISHRWTGVLVYPKRSRPFVTSKNGYWEIFGCGGNGLTNGVTLGTLIADTLKGAPVPDLYR